MSRQPANRGQIRIQLTGVKPARTDGQPEVPGHLSLLLVPAVGNQRRSALGQAKQRQYRR